MSKKKNCIDPKTVIKGKLELRNTLAWIWSWILEFSSSHTMRKEWKTLDEDWSISMKSSQRRLTIGDLIWSSLAWEDEDVNSRKGRYFLSSKMKLRSGRKSTFIKILLQYILNLNPNYKVKVYKSTIQNKKGKESSRFLPLNLYSQPVTGINVMTIFFYKNFISRRFFSKLFLKEIRAIKLYRFPFLQ